MRRRIGWARIISRVPRSSWPETASLPRVIPPTANLDPSARSEVLGLVLEARSAGRTVIFSSHVLSEIETTCDRVVIMRHGQIAHEQSLATLRKRYRIYAQLNGPRCQIPESLSDTISVVKESSNEIVLESTDSLTHVLDWLSNLQLSELKIEPVGLSAVYDRFHREDRRHRADTSLFHSASSPQ